MKNNRGQTLVLFIIFIPIMLMLAAFIIDTGVVMKERSRLESISKIVLKEALETPEHRNEESIRDLYKQNKVDETKLTFTIEESEIKVSANYNVESIFGALIGIKTYGIKLNAIGKIENEKFYYENKGKE